MKPRAVLFAPVDDVGLIDDVGFYRQDVEALRDLGFEVVATNSVWEVVRTEFDLLWVWWWTHALIPVLTARLLRRSPVLVTGVFNYEGLPGGRYVDRPLWQRIPIKAAARLTDSNVFLTEYESSLVGERLGLDPTRVAYAPLEIPLGDGSDSSPEREDFFLQIAWSGRSNLERKCVYETIEAAERYAKQHGGARLIIAGNIGDGSDELRERCKAAGRGLKVEYLGRISEEKKWRLLTTCRAYVSPSRFEGFGLAIAEAIAVGTPTVTSPVGAIPEVAGSGVFMCNGEDPGSILTAIEAAVAAGPNDSRVVEAQRRILERYSPGTRSSEMRRVLEEVGVRLPDQIHSPPDAL